MLDSKPREKDESATLQRAGYALQVTRVDVQRLRQLVVALERNWALWAALILVCIILSSAIGLES